ncbi:MAG: hypothetical protein M0Z67_15860, partial [Nitrospiraceae bacterium]|nr:hypothetical protein [Nitrospiraceae bacterium]
IESCVQFHKAPPWVKVELFPTAYQMSDHPICQEVPLYDYQVFLLDFSPIPSIRHSSFHLFPILIRYIFLGVILLRQLQNDAYS